MKVLSASQIRAADQFTIENEPITSIDLMERASAAFVEKFLAIFPHERPVTIFCGTGNNGGDGLAVGRMLREKRWSIDIFVLGEKGSSDFEKNLKAAGVYTLLTSHKDFPNLGPDQIAIDGIFGSGLTRPVEGLIADLIKHLNDQGVTRVSIDIASGLFADKVTPIGSAVFEPHFTISFQVPKLAFFLPESYLFVGEWFLADIGLSDQFLDEAETSFIFSGEQDLVKLIPRRAKFSHKGKAGKLLVVAGSKGKMGAAVLCTKATLRTGVGPINVQVPKCGVNILQISVPEAMVIDDLDEGVISKLEVTDSTIAIGPGIGTSDKTKAGLKDFLESTESRWF